LQDTGWAVVEIDGEPIIEDTEVRLEFDGDGRLTGNGGCNGYGGAYTAGHDGMFDAHDVAMTLMACTDPEGVMDQETAFHAALREATAYELDGDSLRLLDDSGTVRLLLVSTFDPDEPVTDEPTGLRGTTWFATAINGEPPARDQPYTLQLAVNGPTGKAGCASWWMQFIMESDGSITHETRVSPSVYGAFCEDDDASADAQEYVDTMANATSYVRESDTLHLMDDEGTIVLEFQRGLDGGELDGTSWVLNTLNGEAPLDGTNLTLTFDFEWATGESGCNGFGGPYMVVEPGTVVFADVAHTEMGCMDPDGVMEQESGYFETLHQVTGYVLTDDSLQLLDVDGETLLAYEPAPDMYGLENSFWILTTMNGDAVLPDAPPSLEFRPYGISGWSGCNAYGLHWEYITLDETSLVIGDVETGEQGCDEPIGGQEREYYATLTEVENYTLTDKTLEMMNATGDVVLVFQRTS
jgi:heat shock protein HslJ